MNVFSDQARTLLRPNAAWLAFAAAVALSAVGIAAIATVDPVHAVDQARWLFIALAAMLVCILPHPRHLSLIAFPLFALCLLLLIILLAPGVPAWLVRPRHGARCWIDLGPMDFEPGEAAKIVFVLALARYLRYRENFRSLPGMFTPFLLMLVPVVLILKQPDLGMALLFPPTLLAMLVAAGAKLRHLLALLLIAVIFMAVNVAVIAIDPPRISPAGLPQPPPASRAWMHLLRPHQEARIAAILSHARGDTRYVQNIGYQQDIAVTLLGAGQVNGYGQARSAVIFKNNYLPANHNDMIFAVIVNAWGFWGGGSVIALYLLLVTAFLLLVARTRDPFTRLACVGFAGLTFTQAVINIGMTVGLLPITGITLPFVSYGGTSLLMTFAMIGLALNFASRRDAPLARPSFEFDPRHAFA